MEDSLKMKMLLGGDLMLGRLVNQAMLGGSGGGKDARIVQYWMDAWGIQLPVNIKYPWEMHLNSYKMQIYHYSI
jgi:hypothetical protein